MAFFLLLPLLGHTLCEGNKVCLFMTGNLEVTEQVSKYYLNEWNELCYTDKFHARCSSAHL